MSSFIKSRLGGRLALVTIIAFIIASLLFVLLSESLAMCFSGAGYFPQWQEIDDERLSSLRNYVAEKNMTVDEVTNDVTWAEENEMAGINISTSPEMTFWQNGETWNANGVPIQCADGTVYVYSSKDGKSVARIIAFPVAAAGFLLITIPYSYKTIQRIMLLNREIELLVEDDMKRPVVMQGNDEISMLADSVENMKLSVIAQLEKKNEDLQPDGRLIRSLSHDLRTPLTRLTGYLDIMRYKKYSGDEELEMYLNNAAKNAEEVRMLSDEMFARLVSAVPETGSNILSGKHVAALISECSDELRHDNFIVSTDITTSRSGIEMHELQFQRILDNIMSNIKKYADPVIPVEITAATGEEGYRIVFKNGVTAKGAQPGNGIGLPTVNMLLEESGGTLEYYQENETFITSMRIPEIKQI